MAYIVLALALALPGAALANLCYNFDLYADQDVLVGYVAVCNVADQLKVEFNTISSGWPITATHLWVGDDWEDVPQKNGNPIPGQFPYSGYHDGVTVFSYYIPYDAAAGDPVYIAAHAVVWDPASETMMTVCSDGNESYTAYNNAVLGPDGSALDGRTGTAQPSAEPYGEQTDNDQSLWDLYVDPPFYTSSGATNCADWIWENNFQDGINMPVNLVKGDRVEFTENFTILGLPVGGTLWATADNGYEAYVNTTTTGSPLISGQLFGDWWNSNLKQASVNSDGWQSVESAALTGLTMGDNYLFFRAANEYMNSDDSPNGSPGDALISQVWPNQWIFVDSAINPGGIIWQAEIHYLGDDETAWGADEGPATLAFPGKNWATYIEYTWQEEPNGD